MIHKLLAGKGRMKKVVSLLLCLALLGSSVISTNVSAADADTDVTVEAETAEVEDESAAVSEEPEAEAITETGNDTVETTVADFVDEAAAAATANETPETATEEDAAETEVALDVVEEAPADNTTEGTDNTATENSENNGISTTSLEDSDEGISLTAGKPNPGGSSGSTYYVYWDTIDATYNASGNVSSVSALGSTVGITSVSISGDGVNSANSGVVEHANGSTTTGWTTETETVTTTNDSNDTVTITIVPDSGYYVTLVTICCASSGNNGQKPEDCKTFDAGGGFRGKYSLADAGTIKVDVALNDTEAGFHHNNTGATAYFILIEVAKIPSPLYVEYDYGAIVDSLTEDGYSATEFTSSSNWTIVTDGNEYGDTAESGESATNGIMTSDTQYKYTYDANDTSSSNEDWEHYANSISEAALAQAAADGYYFVGWLATYYTTCDVTETTDDKGNDWTYTFSSQYGTTSEYYQPGDEVPLTVHVQLVAQWIKVTPDPGNLTITKTFDGLSGSEYPASITFVVYNSSGVQVGTVILSSENGWTGTVESLNPGTYTVVETSGYDVNGYTCTTDKSISVTLGYTSNKTLNSDNTYTYTVKTTNGSVSFVNTYEKSTTSVTVKKVWSDSGNAYGLQPSNVTVNLLKNGEQYSVGGDSDNYIVKLSSENDWTYTWSNLPIYEDNNQEISWTVSEDEVAYYETEITNNETVTEGIGYVITNTLNTTDITVIKNVTGNMGDTTKTFTFTYEVTAGDVTITNNGSFDLLDYNQNSNDSEVIEGVPVGATITLMETNGEGYTTSVTYSDGTVSESDGVYTVKVGDGDNQIIIVTNDKTAIPDTGIGLDSAPYILMLAGVAVLGGVVLFRRRKRLL